MSLQKLLSTALSPQEIDCLVKQELANILACCKPETVILFGSAARQQMRTCSDLDLIVIFSSADEIEQGKTSYYCSPRPRTWPVDVLFISRIDFDHRSKRGGVYLIAAEEGKIIYGGGKHGTP